MSQASNLGPDGLPAGYNFRPDWEVTPRQVKAWLDQKQDFILIDCRTPMENQVAAIEGAWLVPLQELGSRVEELDALSDKKIVIHCHHGGRSLQSSTFLRQRGFKDVKSMAGGIDVWALDIDPTLARY